MNAAVKEEKEKKPRKTTTRTKPKEKKIKASEEKQEEVKENEPEMDEALNMSEHVVEDARGKKPDRYFEAVGRRKTAIARVRLFTRAGDFTVNEKPYGTYFSTVELQKITEDALKKMKLLGRFRVSVHLSGGGIHSQAEALRHGLSRCLVKFNPDFRKRLKRAHFLTRDPRMKERKKFGLKRARKAPQWAKR